MNLLAYLAAKTSTIRLGTGVVVLPKLVFVLFKRPCCVN
jgi:alkanesulfonate monooxygenase SsuD/methylene tetrahydromethanopterin reductase-like flavin-dependent oxidoreductase (luciferase family)